jgi:hypothetical protein
MTDEQAIEKEIQAKGLNAPRLAPSDIDAAIVSETYHRFPGTTLTVCALTLRNGFQVTGESAAASPENYDEAIGRKIARDNARGKIWALEGYLLKSKLAGTAGALTAVGIARVCHEVNRAYCASLGDHSQLPWKEAPQWQRDSAIDGVEFIKANQNAGPSASHDNWARQKRLDGWVYGTVKDPEKKTHPCLVPFHDLPQEQQAKDFIFKAIVSALA